MTTTNVEIPFRIGSTKKWISGISEDTTCSDILVAVLKSELLLDCPEDTIHHHYALVETWRQVSKVLSPNSLILKIWRAWDEEQVNVTFTVKRVKENKRQSLEKSSSHESKPRKTVRRHNSKVGAGPKQVDTVHPRALNRSKQMMCKEIHDQMRKIINQGEIIRKHLETIKDLEVTDDQIRQPSEDKTTNNKAPNVILSTSPKTNNDSGHISPKSDITCDSAIHDSSINSPETKPRSESISAFLNSENNLQKIIQNKRDIDEDISSGTRILPEELSKGSVQENSNLHKNPQSFQDNSPECNKTLANDKSRINSSPYNMKPSYHPKNDSQDRDNDRSNEDRDSTYNLLESIHRLNCILESKEEQVLTLGSTVGHMKADGQPSPSTHVQSDQVKSCFDDEVARYRDLNAKLLHEIQENSGHLAELVKNTDIRRKMVTQLEFDVNIIERESKRLQSDLTTIQSLNTNIEEVDMLPKEQTPSEKVQRQSPQIRGTQETSSLSFKQDYKVGAKKMLEYGSDSSSDTGVCSLSSSEGDYSLSTLV